MFQQSSKIFKFFLKSCVCIKKQIYIGNTEENITRTGRKNIEQDLMAVMELKQMFEVCFSEQKAPGRKKCQACEHATVCYLKPYISI